MPPPVSVSEAFAARMKAFMQSVLGTEKVRLGRKFTQIFQDIADKLPNFDPPKKIRVGDVGRIDKDTGGFEWHGNIYDEEGTKELFELWQPISGHPEDKVIISSQNAKVGEVSNEQLDNSVLSGKWSFGQGHRGVLLVMIQSRLVHMPDEIWRIIYHNDILRKRYQEDGFVLVTEVHECPAYTLYLSTSENDSIELAVHTGTSDPAAYKWSNKSHGGITREAANSDPGACYWPLYKIKNIQELRRGTPLPWNKMWVDAELPWVELNDDGEEINVYVYTPWGDTDSDSEDD